MSPTKEFEQGLVAEYDRAKATLVTKFSAPLEKQAAKQSIDSTLLVCSAKQTELIINTLPSQYLAGIYIESDALSRKLPDALSRKLPAYVGFDFSGKDVPINTITKDTIGRIGNFNEGVANDLKLRYGNLVSDNELITQLDKHGWTAATERRMVGMGFDRETIDLVKQQTTTNKMIQILGQQGLKGNLPPNEVAKLLVPHIKGVFGDKGVTIDNIGSMRKTFTVDADGNYKWGTKKVTQAYHTTTKNYADIIARSTMLDADRAARYTTLQQSGFVKAYRSIAVMDERTGHLDAMMHGVLVNWGEGAPYHARCRCEYEPVWKKETGLANKPDDYYFDKRDKFFWKQHQLKKYNATLPKGSKIPNANFLPKDMLKGMPDAAGMRNIRATILKQPMIPTGDKAIADDLWALSSKDGLEHGMIINKEQISVVGLKHEISLGMKGKHLKNITTYHTHPTWDCPTSSADIASFLYYSNQKSAVAISNKSLYKLTRTKATPELSLKKAKAAQVSMKKWANKEDLRLTKLTPNRSPDLIYHDALENMNRKMAKKYHFNYEVTPRT